jgi:hypothetical protein
MDHDDSPAPTDLLLRDRLSAIIAALRRLQPLAVRAQAQSRRLIDGYNLMYQTQGANAWTFRQLQSREVVDEQRKEFDLNLKVLRTWEEKVRSALIHVEQQTAFISQDGRALRGPVDHLVQAHLTQMAASRNRQQLADGRHAGRTGGGGGGGASKTSRRLPRGPKTPPAAKPAAKDKRKRSSGAGAKASADAADGGNN